MSGPATELWLSKDAVLANRYRIERELGEGGMGRVYAAWDDELECRVAIKTLRQILGTDALLAKRLQAEARLSMDLTHPNIVRVHNLELGSRTKFLVMEYVEGESLAQRIGREEKLGEEETRRIAIEICKGLEHAHDRNIIHRDLKSANILLGKNGAVKVADFGIARECRDSMTRLTGEVIGGTLLYMSPEQLAGKSTKLSDLYSLGALMYEMLSGQPPFHAGLIAYQIENHQPESIEGISAEMNAMVLRLLEKKPENRFGSMHELREELQGSAAAMRRAEEERLCAEEQRKAEEAHRRMEEQRKEEEQRKQAELEANRRKEEERLKQEEGRRKEEEARAAALRRAEEGRLRAEEQRKAEEACRRMEEQRKGEERRKQAELEANRRKEEERRRQEEARRKEEEARAAALRGAEEERLRAEEQRRAEEARRRMEEQRKEEERRKQAELEANRRKEEERRKQEEGRHKEEERKRAAAGLAAAALTLLARRAFDKAETKLQEALSLDPGHAGARLALDRCRAQKAAAEEPRRRTQSQKTTSAVAKPDYGRRAAIGLVSVGILVVFLWLINCPPHPPGVGPQKTSAEIARLKQQFRNFISARDWRSAGIQLESLLKIAPNDGEALSWRKQLDREVENERVAAKLKPVANSYGMEFVSIPAGRFMMGCSAGDSQCQRDEYPRHEVTISRSFELGKYEVNQGQWVKVMGNNPSGFKGGGHLPVERVSWNDTQAFISKLNALNDGYRYRLPTEAEWEYAARGGTVGPYYGWYDANSERKTHPVGQKQPNGYGLYDTLGNVWEWCSDWYGESYYRNSPQSDPNGPPSGQYRVLRGGSWNVTSRFARVSVRAVEISGVGTNSVGFRVCREKLSSFGTKERSSQHGERCFLLTKPLNG